MEKCTQTKWKSDQFKFLKGLFQGDPLSGIIFLIVFTPIVEYIMKHAGTHGYEIFTETNTMNVITTPFADHFNIITRSKSIHQTIVTEVKNKLLTMGLKASKCRSLSIQSETVTNFNFQLRDQSGSPVIIDSGDSTQMQCLKLFIQN